MTSAPTKPSEALRAARELLTPEGAWTQGVAARDAAGNEVQSNSPDAVCFCSYGALWHVAGIKNDAVDLCELLLSDVIEGRTGEPFIDHWNDAEGRKHEEVLSVFDAALYMAERSGQ